MEPQEELQQLRDREEALKQELKAKKKELQEAQRRQRNTLTRQIRRAQARVSAADRKTPHPPLDPPGRLPRPPPGHRCRTEGGSHGEPQ